MYDGTTSATISSNNVVLGGVVSGDVVNLSLNGYAASFASAGVSNGISVNVTGLTLTGASATNYSLTQPVVLAASITSKALTVSSGLSANNKVYDGTTSATVSSNNVVLGGVVLAGTRGTCGASRTGMRRALPVRGWATGSGDGERARR